MRHIRKTDIRFESVRHSIRPLAIDVPQYCTQFSFFLRLFLATAVGRLLHGTFLGRYGLIPASKVQEQYVTLPTAASARNYSDYVLGNAALD